MSDTTGAGSVIRVVSPYVMRTLPTDSREWTGMILLPFKAYTVVGAVGGLLWYFCLPPRSGFVMAQVGRFALPAFVLCGLTLVLGSLLQFLMKARRAALVSFLFAVAAISVWWWFSLYTPSLGVAARSRTNFSLHWTGSSRFSQVSKATPLAAAPGQ
jgi:hypothetical protein